MKEGEPGVQVGVLDVDDPACFSPYRAFCRRLTRRVGLRGELSILLTGDGRMRELNRRYRNVDRTTDVLSFPMPEPPGGRGRVQVAAGDVVISLPAARRNAKRYDVPEEEELERLTVHGVLHLCGMDHRGPRERATMRERQERLLDSLRRGRES